MLSIPNQKRQIPRSKQRVRNLKVPRAIFGYPFELDFRTGEPLLQTGTPLAIGDTIELSKEESKHLTGSLRRSSGDEIDVVDPRSGTIYRSTIVATTPHTHCQINSLVLSPPASRTHLLVGLPEGKIIESLFEKAIEVGVETVWIFAAERSQNGSARLSEGKLVERLLRIAASAIKQSGAARLPRIITGQTLQEVLAKTADDCAARRLLLVPPKEHITGLEQCAPNIISVFNDFNVQISGLERSAQPVDSYLLVGPEGGLTEREEKIAREGRFIPCSLGPQVLRTETAAIVALAITQMLGEATTEVAA